MVALRVAEALVERGEPSSSTPPREPSSSTPPRPLAPSFSRFFGKAVRILSYVLGGLSTQMSTSVASMSGPAMVDHKPQDSMLGGMMGYSGPLAFGPDEPNLRAEPFSQPGFAPDECSHHLNRWLTRCEWASSSYLELGARVRAAPLTDGGADEQRRADALAVEVEKQKPLEKRIKLPAGLLASYRPEAMRPDFAGAPTALHEAGAGWAKPGSGAANGLSGEPEANADGENCYQAMHFWLERCVLTPM